MSVFLVAALPLGNYFFPFIHGAEEETPIKRGMQAVAAEAKKKAAGELGQAVQRQQADTSKYSNYYSFNRKNQALLPVEPPVAAGGSSMLGFLVSDSSTSRSLSRATRAMRLLPPEYSAYTIPPKPVKSLKEEIEESAGAYLEGDVFKDAVLATYSRAELEARETRFVASVRQDLMDGRLDMLFSDFIIPAEYFQLSHALLDAGRQPNFSLAEAYSRYQERLTRVKADLPESIDAFALVMILQRYAENKYYPGNGSGMFLDSLFHNLNDCEGGTKEVLAYLNAIYPALKLGSNRGMIPTTTGEVIGHMQVYLGSDQATQKIIENLNGLVIETTRVSRDSILPYTSGDVYPMEDFIFRYYPEAIEGTPLMSLYQGGEDGPADGLRFVGTSDHPLKKSYGATSTLLTSQYFDLENIRTRKIENEFLRSSLPSCDPRIDPLEVDRSNLFSNFVTIEPKLRKSLISHYLADLEYWNNRIMPQWKVPPFLVSYQDLATTLLAESEEEPAYIEVDSENGVPYNSLRSHKLFLDYMRTVDEKKDNPYHGKGEVVCRAPVVLDNRLLSFLFMISEGPGLFFLPDVEDSYPWDQLLNAILNECLALSDDQGDSNMLAVLEELAAEQKISLRKELYNRARLRGLTTSAADDFLDERLMVLKNVIAGEKNIDGNAEVLTQRVSAQGSREEPSVEESIIEHGKTGINSGLLWDGFDFIGPDFMQVLLREYGKRSDLRLDVHRTANLIGTTVMAAGGRFNGQLETADYLDGLVTVDSSRIFQLMVMIAGDQLRGVDATEISGRIAEFIDQKMEFRSDTLISMLRYGLLKDDARQLYSRRIAALSATMPEVFSGSTEGFDNIGFFGELVELIRIVVYFQDNDGQQSLDDLLRRSLRKDFTGGVAWKKSGGEVPDYGLLFNKLSALTLLHDFSPTVISSVEVGEQLLDAFIQFAGKVPVGKLMISLMPKLYTADTLETYLADKIKKQFTDLEVFSLLEADLTGDSGAAEFSSVTSLVGDANVIFRLLQLVEGKRVRRLSQPSIATIELADQRNSWYLHWLHHTIAISEVFRARLADSGDNAAVLSYYMDDRVRESFSLLAWSQGDAATSDRVKFRIIKDLRSIKDPSKIKVIEGERKITRQDMSLLTLSLNPGNKPEAIRRVWEDTLTVIGGHMALKPERKEMNHYLFSPHAPYLTENNQGFFYSPETVADFHNAAEWGGRNDILLSSYLHFRNLPERLPQWLLNAALKRSEFERKIIKKFAEQTFLPMILECSSDNDELPKALFRAKWAIRKPFGEDIFPGTLLLLRLGYMDVTPEGELVLTSKYTSG